MKNNAAIKVDNYLIIYDGKNNIHSVNKIITVNATIGIIKFYTMNTLGVVCNWRTKYLSKLIVGTNPNSYRIFTLKGLLRKFENEYSLCNKQIESYNEQIDLIKSNRKISVLNKKILSKQLVLINKNIKNNCLIKEELITIKTL